MPFKTGDPPPRTAFKKGDPRAAEAGRKSKRKSPKQIELDDGAAIVARLMETGLKLPEGATAPTAMEVAELARSLSPATLRFAVDVLGNKASAIGDKFSAANLILKQVPANAAETEEIGKLKTLVDDLRDEHQLVVREMAQEVTNLRKENEALVEQLEDARSKIRTTPAEEIPLPKVARG